MAEDFLIFRGLQAREYLWVGRLVKVQYRLLFSVESHTHYDLGLQTSCFMKQTRRLLVTSSFIHVYEVVADSEEEHYT